MNKKELKRIMSENSDDHSNFELVKIKKSERNDLHAFLLLDSLIPSNRSIISASEHDEIYLDIDLDELSKVITEEQVIELVRCGVRYDSDYDCLSMFV